MASVQNDHKNILMTHVYFFHSHYYYHSPFFSFVLFFCRWQQIWPGDKLSFQLLLSVRRSFFIKPKGEKKIKTFILGVLFVTFWCAGREWKWLVGWQLERRLSDPALLPSTRRRADPVYYTSDSPIIATAPIKKKKLHFRIAVSHLFLTQKGKSILQELIFFFGWTNGWRWHDYSLSLV